MASNDIFKLFLNSVHSRLVYTHGASRNYSIIEHYLGNPGLENNNLLNRFLQNDLTKQ